MINSSAINYDPTNDTVETNTTILESSDNYCEPLNSTYSSSEDEDILLSFITYGILLNTIGIFGIFGNVISMVILSRPQMKSSINYLLIGLARCDTVLIITSILLFGLPAIYSGTGWLFIYYYRIMPVITPLIFPVAMISQTISVYLTLTVTLERFVAVCHPLQARSLCTFGRARLYVIIIIIFSVLYNITRFSEVTVRECIHNKYKVPVYRIYPSDLRNERMYINVYIHWMYLVFMYFIPFGFLAILNTAIYRQVRRANKERQRLSRLQKKEIGLATMLLCVVIVFLICNVGALISNVLEAFYGLSIDFLVETGNLMITINSSVNFVIYVTFGEKFRRLFFKLFFPHGRICGISCGMRESPDHTYDDSFISHNGDGRSSTIRHLRRLNTASCIKYGSKSSCRQTNRRARSVSRLPRASSPGPCVYYPQRESRGSWEHTSVTNF